MAGSNNGEQFLASEPEMDMTQFRHVEYDLKYADQSENQILDIIYPDEGGGTFPPHHRVPRRSLCDGA